MDLISDSLSTFGAVFAIIDPFGYVPIFITLTGKKTETERRFILKKACVTALLVLAVSTLIGKQILGFFGISIPALQISGGLILLVIAFEMLKVIPIQEKLSSSEEREAEMKDDISIIPLAIPMLSGPASIAAVVVLGSEGTGVPGLITILASIAVTLAFTYFVLRSASRIMKLIGITGLNVMTRVMGLLLCALAIQFIINGYVAVK